MVRGETVCTPEDEEALRKDGSYPSGHTSIGWGWALILTELAPDRAEAILARGRSFGESRNVCNAHWYSDVVAGRLVGAAAVGRLHASEEFDKAMDAARADIERMRREGKPPQRDCAAEAEVLSTGLRCPNRLDFKSVGKEPRSEEEKTVHTRFPLAKFHGLLLAGSVLIASNRMADTFSYDQGALPGAKPWTAAD